MQMSEWYSQPQLGCGQQAYMTVSVPFVCPELKMGGQDCHVQLGIYQEQTPPGTPQVRLTTSSPDSAQRRLEGLAFHSLQASVLLENPGELRFRTPALSSARDSDISCQSAERSASTATH